METRKHSGEEHSRRNNRTKMLQKAIISSVVGLMLALGAVSNSILQPAFAAANTLTVDGLALDGKPLSMRIVVQSEGSTVKTGFTPLTFSGNEGASYSVIARDYLGGDVFFDHWEDGSTSRTNTVTLDEDVALTAYYQTPESESPSLHILTINAFDQNNNELPMYTTIRDDESTTTVKTGFTPMTHEGVAGETFSVTVSNYGSLIFDHWEDGSTERTRTITLDTDVTFAAYYKTPDDVPQQTLVVNAYDQDGNVRNMYTTIREDGTTIQTGFTPLTFEGTAGATYSVNVYDYARLAFDHWEDGSIDRARTIVLDEDVSVTAYYFDEAADTTHTEETNAAPSATDDSGSTYQDTPVTIDVLANDSDPDGDALKVMSVTDPANGNATNNGDGTVTYTPTSDFTGTDSFNYTISDDNENSATGEVIVTVTAVASASSQLPTSYDLIVNAEDMSGNPKTGMYTTISEGSVTVKTGFKQVSYTGTADSAYSVTVYNYGSSVFDHWEDGSTERTRTIMLNSDMVMTAYYRVPELELTPASGVGGSTTITTTGYYFSPESSVTVTYDGQIVASVNINSTGSFSTSFLAPSSGPGLHTVHAEDSRGWEAYSSFKDTTVPEPHSSSEASSKTGVFVALYMYPGSTGSAHWQKVIDEKKEHPSVPIVAAFNPSGGPGSSKNSNIAYWVDKLQDAGVIAIGYVADDYGTKSLSTLRSDVDKYVNWYGADGLFIDEFTNKVGYESHYQQITDYAKSRGMEMTMGNPGTDVPPSYIGTVDVINTSEGKGYTSTTDQNLIGSSWVSGGYSGWHKDHDKGNFSIIRYDISSGLDASYVDAVSDWAGLVYITDGNDSNHRWFHVPPYFGELVAALDK